MLWLCYNSKMLSKNVNFDELKKDFIELYEKIDDGIKDTEFIDVPKRGTFSWNTAKNEISDNTEIGTDILKEMEEHDIIKIMRVLYLRS